MNDWRSTDPFHLCEETTNAAKARVASLGIPSGSLGRLHDLAIQLAGITKTLSPPLQRCEVIVFSGDHGVAKKGVSAFPQSVTDINTRRMAEGTATISVMAAALNVNLCVVDIGVDAPSYSKNITSNFAFEFLDRKISRGTEDITTTAAMSYAEVCKAIEIGFDIISRKHSNIDVLVLGEMGIGNTTSSSALTSFLLDLEASSVTGLGSGITNEALIHKQEIVQMSVARARNEISTDDAVAALQQLGGFEIAGMVGAFIAAAKFRIPVLLDGFITSTAFLVASRLVGGIEKLTIPGTKSTEPGFVAIAQQFGFVPIVDLGMRLGEGTGALVSYPIIKLASLHLSEGDDMANLINV